jgi:hypothetical protein
MGKHESNTNDPARYAAVLETEPELTVTEAAALTTLAREWMGLAADAIPADDYESRDSWLMWYDFRDLYLSARSIFIRKFFEVTRG